MRWRTYLLRRLVLFVPQVLAVVTIVFVIVRLLPGNPAYLLAGPRASAEQIAAVTRDLGLDQPIPVQYLRYMGGLARGDLDRSFLTSQPVAVDLLHRFPATLELITCAVILAFLIAIPLGVASALWPGGIVGRIAGGYGLLAGALPDFWWGLMLALVFFGILGVVPAPIGRIDLSIAPPPTVTGFYTVDSLVTGNWAALGSSLAHLVLPAVTLAFVYAGPIVKITQSSMREALGARYIRYATALGLSRATVTRYALRNALLPVITMVAIVYAYLLSGDVLIEQVFGWGGVGQYAVQAVASSDYAALTGVVLSTTLFSLSVYLVVDLLYLAIDPRVQY